MSKLLQRILAENGLPQMLNFEPLLRNFLIARRLSCVLGTIPQAMSGKLPLPKLVSLYRNIMNTYSMELDLLKVFGNVFIQKGRIPASLNSLIQLSGFIFLFW
jgi:hypothetical protein